mgnify:CR=1 FL=1
MLVVIVLIGRDRIGAFFAAIQDMLLSPFRRRRGEKS